MNQENKTVGEPIYQVKRIHGWVDISESRYAEIKADPNDLGELRIVYAAPPSQHAEGGETDARDAARYRWLRDTLHGAKAGGGIEVNDALQVYEDPIPGEEVRIYWYLHTPVGFHQITASTLDEAIDEGLTAARPASGETE